MKGSIAVVGMLCIAAVASAVWMLDRSHVLLRDDYSAGYEIGQNHEPYNEHQMQTLCEEQMDERYGADAPPSDAISAFKLGCHDATYGIDKDYARIGTAVDD